MTSEYVPTTDEVIRSFSIPAHRVVEHKDGESFADYLSRASIETNELQMESEAAARRWLAEHDAQLVENLAEVMYERAGGRYELWLREWAQKRRKRA